MFLELLRMVLSRRFWVIVFSTIALFWTLGYLSNRFSMARCERLTAVDLVKTYLRGTPVHLSARGDVDSKAVFAAAGVTVLPDPPSGQRLYPYASVRRGRSLDPFVVEVEYSWAAGHLVAKGRVRRYFCLVGYLSEIRDDGVWVS